MAFWFLKKCLVFSSGSSFAFLVWQFWGKKSFSIASSLDALSWFLHNWPSTTFHVEEKWSLAGEPLLSNAVPREPGQHSETDAQWANRLLTAGVAYLLYKCEAPWKLKINGNVGKECNVLTILGFRSARQDPPLGSLDFVACFSLCPTSLPSCRHLNYSCFLNWSSALKSNPQILHCQEGHYVAGRNLKRKNPISTGGIIPKGKRTLVEQSETGRLYGVYTAAC